jgi:hypothetical protein
MARDEHRRGLSDEELEALDATELPDREALTVIKMGLPLVAPPPIVPLEADPSAADTADPTVDREAE